jgi:hypothetical protein
MNTHKKKILLAAWVLIFFLSILDISFMVFADKTVSFTEHIVTKTHYGIYGVAIGDIDRDGVKDFVGCGYGYSNSKLSWYKTNSEYTTWTEYIIDNTNGYFKVELMDANNDGKLEIIATHYLNNTIYLFNATNPTDKWTRRIIATNVNPGYQMNLSDFNKDGYTDIVAASPYGNIIRWYKNNGDFTFSSYIVNLATSIRGIHAGDINGDGWIDVVGGLGGNMDDVIWCVNDGTPEAGTWIVHTIDSSAPNSPSSIFVYDINNDGYNDVVAGGLDGDGLVWYKNIVGDGSTWTKYEVSTVFNEILGVWVADLDKDSDGDIVVTTTNDNTVAWFENLNGIGTNWMRHDLNTSLTHAVYCRTGVFKENGGIDIFACGKDAYTLLWFESNLTEEPPTGDISFYSINGQTNDTVVYSVIKDFKWTKMRDTVYYQLQIANDSNFTDVFVDINVNETLYPDEYNEVGAYVEFELPEVYRRSWRQYYYFRVRNRYYRA